MLAKLTFPSLCKTRPSAKKREVAQAFSHRAKQAPAVEDSPTDEDMEPMAPPGSNKPGKGFPKKRDVFLKPLDSNGRAAGRMNAGASDVA